MIIFPEAHEEPQPPSHHAPQLYLLLSVGVSVFLVALMLVVGLLRCGKHQTIITGTQNKNRETTWNKVCWKLAPHCRMWRLWRNTMLLTCSKHANKHQSFVVPGGHHTVYIVFILFKQVPQPLLPRSRRPLLHKQVRNTNLLPTWLCICHCVNYPRW